LYFSVHVHQMTIVLYWTVLFVTFVRASQTTLCDYYINDIALCRATTSSTFPVVCRFVTPKVATFGSFPPDAPSAEALPLRARERAASDSAAMSSVVHRERALPPTPNTGSSTSSAFAKKYSHSKDKASQSLGLYAKCIYRNLSYKLMVGVITEKLHSQKVKGQDYDVKVSYASDS